MTKREAIRVAAAGDIHCSEENRAAVAAAFACVADQVDAILVAGDLTTFGEPEQAEVLAAELAKLPQQCMRSDRLSVLNQWGKSEADAMDFEFGTLSKVSAESLEGAARFAAGAGRHGASA